MTEERVEALLCRRSKLAVVLLLLAVGCASSPPALHDPGLPGVTGATGSPSARARVSGPRPAAALPPSPSPDLALLRFDPMLDDVGPLLLAKDFKGAKRLLEARLAKLDEGRLDAKLVAHVLMARALLALGDEMGAARHYEIVREDWRDPPAALELLTPPGTGEEERAERVGRALDAVGEAHFFAAERLRIEASKVRAPAPSPTDEDDGFKRYSKEKLAPWVAARSMKNNDAEMAFTRIANLQPMSPPRWIVAANERVGAMWAAYTAEIRAIPTPKAWNQRGKVLDTDIDWTDLRAAYRDAIEEAVGPLDARARAAYETCARLAKQLRVDDEHSRACVAWLK